MRVCTTLKKIHCVSNIDSIRKCLLIIINSGYKLDMADDLPFFACLLFTFCLPCVYILLTFFYILFTRCLPFVHI